MQALGPVGLGHRAFLVELARQEADYLVGIAEARLAVLLDQLFDQSLVLPQVIRQRRRAAYRAAQERATYSRGCTGRLKLLKTVT